MIPITVSRKVVQCALLCLILPCGVITIFQERWSSLTGIARLISVRLLIYYLDDYWETHDEAAMVFSGMLFNWGHKMAYDFQSLTKRLEHIGFTDIQSIIQSMEWGISQRVPSLMILESGDSPRRFESLIIECRKPAFV